MKYDLNLLPVLLVMIEERNVTRAAERLGITQPALSNALNRLRETLNDPLFIRERYGMRPTPKAEQLAQVVGAALSSIDKVILGQQDFDPLNATRLFTLAPNSYVEFIMMPAIVARLRSCAPGIRLRLTPFGNDVTETGVISGNTDMVLGRIVEPPDNLVVQHLMNEGLACVIRADHPLVGEKLSAEQYEQLKHVNVLPPGRMRAGLYQALEQRGLRRQVAVSVTHFLAVPEMIAVTDYCATLPRLICQHLSRDQRLRIVPAPVDLGTFPVEMGWHARYRDDPAHRWFRTLITETAQSLSDPQINN
ncbi:LysR substrate-binding domain-containing protein [Pantoea agglomerans]|uniref:DNA-binding transcriptional LysR family regulator n=1 Tax=Enterobacter agglomerans TaxID=549 RepID=A0ABD6XX57_ENTAG|nr:LysR substrate-binding domain-containing protein [Pantoea agglomerans]MCH9405697.1 LysR substrate-binding domain-containing protein [Pantoea agglomerans]WNK32932.1 LysR substrate-binding domain-containing protein [Pantoea agglomerans]WNK37634.1 LysR substrate-binding domain-containing protein [Pantoea agglomerans]WNK55810.1 LysR substrate-binding domain-containing protein [Pantoea agglomerans]WNK64703.1 LysR substrate-binding domain-containing protein [Pantoea agglomerans]